MNKELAELTMKAFIIIATGAIGAVFSILLIQFLRLEG